MVVHVTSSSRQSNTWIDHCKSTISTKYFCRLFLIAMLFAITLIVALLSVVHAVPITRSISTFPECSLTCYNQAVLDFNLEKDAFETHCRSAPFFFSFRDCVFYTCGREEFTSVVQYQGITLNLDDENVEDFLSTGLSCRSHESIVGV